MSKIRGITDQDGFLGTYLFWCPGCACPHPYRIARSPREPASVPVWGFNGDLERPTFSPSLLVNANTPGARRCHLFLTDGALHFCADSDHELAGKTVPCPDWDSERW